MADEYWTINSLKQYMESLIAANDERYAQRFLDSQTAVQAALSAARTAVDAALSAAKEAVAKAEAASEKRFANVDEFRATLADQQRNLMPRTETEMLISSLVDRIRKLEDTGSVESGTRRGNRDTWAWIVAAVGVLFGLVSSLLNYLKEKP